MPIGDRPIFLETDTLSAYPSFNPLRYLKRIVVDLKGKGKDPHSEPYAAHDDDGWGDDGWGGDGGAAGGFDFVAAAAEWSGASNAQFFASLARQFKGSSMTHRGRGKGKSWVGW